MITRIEIWDVIQKCMDDCCVMERDQDTIVDHLDIRFSKRFSRVMGRCEYMSGVLGTPGMFTKTFYTLKFSTKIFNLVDKENQIETVVHEFCHLLEHFFKGTCCHQKGKVGDESNWRHYMSLCGYDHAETYHNVDLTTVRRKRTRYLQTCECGTKHRLTSHKFNQIMSGSFSCSDCSAPIVWTNFNKIKI